MSQGTMYHHQTLLVPTSKGRGTLLLLIMLVTSLTLCSCREKVEHGGKHPLVQAGDAFLYMEDLNEVIPARLSAVDSATFAENYIRHWIEEEMLYDKAEHNVRDSRKLEQMVNDYRRALIMHEYRQRLIRQDLVTQLGDNELQAFYDKNKDLFVLEEPVLKGLFIKAPLTAPDLKDLKKWYKDKSEEALEKLEKYALRNTVIYEYFYDHWVTISDLEGKIAIDLAGREKDFDKQKDIEVEDNEFCYLLHIEEYVPTGQIKPYELARNEIVDLLANLREVEFIRQVKTDLYNQAHEMGRIKYFSNETTKTTNDSVQHSVSHAADNSTR